MTEEPLASARPPIKELITLIRGAQLPFPSRESIKSNSSRVAALPAANITISCKALLIVGVDIAHSLFVFDMYMVCYGSNVQRLRLVVNLSG